MPDARFGMVRPSGKFKFLDRTILKKNGNLHKKAVLHALGIPFSIEPDRRYASGCPKGEEVCHITNYHIKEDFLDAGSKIPNHQGDDGIKNKKEHHFSNYGA